MPSAADVAASLTAAATNARKAYNAAVAANPDGNFGPLYAAQMTAANAAAAAIDKALNSDPAVAKAQADLDKATQDIKSKLDTLTDIQQWLTLLNNLATLATTVSKFFV